MSDELTHRDFMKLSWALKDLVFRLEHQGEKFRSEINEYKAVERKINAHLEAFTREEGKRAFYTNIPIKLDYTRNF